MSHVEDGGNHIDYKLAILRGYIGLKIDLFPPLCGGISLIFQRFGKVVGDPGIEPGVRLREGVTVPCHTLRPVAHCQGALRPT